MPTEPNYNDIGKLLRKAREEKHMAIEYVAQQLHIRTRYLDALEAGRLSELPGISYAKGYLQVYANFVGLDKDEVLRRFEDVEEHLGRRGFFLPQVFRKEKAPSLGVIWGGLAGAVVIYLLWLGLQPSRLPSSLVEPFSHEKAEIMPTSLYVPCLNADPVLYPPCTMQQYPLVSLISLQAEMKVMLGAAAQQTVEK